MGYRLEDIATSLEAEAFGDLTIVIERLSEPSSAGSDDLALAMKPEYAEDIAKGQARAAMLWPGADWQALGLAAAIIPARPRYAMAGVTVMLDPGQGFAVGIHPSAVIDSEAVLGENVSVGPLAVISAGARIGAKSVIGPQCFIGSDVHNRSHYCKTVPQLCSRLVAQRRNLIDDLATRCPHLSQYPFDVSPKLLSHPLPHYNAV